MEEEFRTTISDYDRRAGSSKDCGADLFYRYVYDARQGVGQVFGSASQQLQHDLQKITLKHYWKWKEQVRVRAWFLVFCLLIFTLAGVLDFTFRCT